MSNVEAREGQWYLRRVNDETFCVIAVDEAHGVIDILDGYGDIDEVGFDEWELMDLELCAAPSNWAEVFEVIDEGELDPGAPDDRPHNGASQHY